MNEDLHQEGNLKRAWPMYDVAGARAVEAAAIEAKGEEHSYTLMQRAGQAAADLATDRWPGAQSVAIFCGTGNNGGDGYVMAAALARDSIDVTVFQTGAPTTADANRAANEARAAQISIRDAADFQPGDFKLVVDALIGIGMSRAPEGAVADAIGAINSAGVPVFALDVPSGVDASTGNVPGVVVDAEATLTFIVYKVGTLTGPGRRYSGDVAIDELRVWVGSFDAATPAARLLRLPAGRWKRFERRVDVHKGENGHVLVIGGDSGMGGAVRLAGEAALRAGAGLVTIATRASNIAPIVSARPELMVHAVDSPTDLRKLIARADVIAIGPGLGQGEWGIKLLGASLDHDKPMVIDADGLTLLAASPEKRENWVLTPHPGEAATLLGVSTSEINADRVGAHHAMTERYGGSVILKGAGTLVNSANGQLKLSRAGNPGMATAGSGDVLTGIVAALLAQQIESDYAVGGAVLLHAAAGDLAAEDGMIGMVAGDLIASLRQARANMVGRN